MPGDQQFLTPAEDDRRLSPLVALGHEGCRAVVARA
jgi:hypothetical protein